MRRGTLLHICKKFAFALAKFGLAMLGNAPLTKIGQSCGIAFYAGSKGSFMFSRLKTLATGLAFAVALSSVAAVPALASSRDKLFFKGVQGQWNGPGEIIAGKYKGTKFNCSLSGSTDEGTVGITLDGYCRVGVFRQPMKAVIRQAGRTYKGQFLDGAQGKGLDIVSGNVTGQKMVVGINRQKLNGAMIARLQGDNTMTVTISVKVDDQMIPVIGMSLNRQVDEIAVGSIK
jgi:hypothetical protein